MYRTMGPVLSVSLLALLFLCLAHCAHVPDTGGATGASTAISSGIVAEQSGPKELSEQFKHLLNHYPHYYGTSKKRSHSVSSSLAASLEASIPSDLHLEDLNHLDKQQLHLLFQHLNRPDKSDEFNLNGKAISVESKLDTGGHYKSAQDESPVPPSPPPAANYQADKVDSRNEPPGSYRPAEAQLTFSAAAGGGGESKSGTGSGVERPCEAMHDMLSSLDSRLQKVQDSLYLYRSMQPKFSPHLNSGGYFSPVTLIKSQLLNMENILETRFSNLEHKFANLEIEDGMWKKTINWKMDETLSKNENKISYSSEQVVNKLDLIERNLKVVTNDFFSKFLLVNEKLNKIEYNLQAKLADFEAKMRKNLNYQQRLNNLMKEGASVETGGQHDHDLADKKSIDLKDLLNLKANPLKPVKTNNVTQRILKLINMKQTYSAINRTKPNSTFLFDSLRESNHSTFDPNMISNDAPMASVPLAGGHPEERNPEKSALGSESHRGHNKSVHNQMANNRNLDMVYSEPVDVSFKTSRSGPHWLDNNHNYEEYERCRKVIEFLSQKDANFENLNPITICANIVRFEVDPYGGQVESRQPGEKGNVEKRDLDNEEIVIEQKRLMKEVTGEKLNMVEESAASVAHKSHQLVSNSKLEELDNKLQFFSTKIIKIVQEMWLSSQASESYMKETLSIANKTKTLLKEEFARLQVTLKPINQIGNVAEEIRDPIVTRLREMSTAINNSVGVILNTQAQYFNSIRSMREDEQVYEVLDIFFHEMRNKSAIGMQQVNRTLLEQSSQLNHSMETILQNLNQIGKKTIDGVKAETGRLMDIVRSELYRIGHNYDKRSFVASVERNMERVSSARGSGQCNQQCFITKEEFAHICNNNDNRHYEETPQPLQQPPPPPPPSPQQSPPPSSPSKPKLLSSAETVDVSHHQFEDSEVQQQQQVAAASAPPPSVPQQMTQQQPPLSTGSGDENQASKYFDPNNNTNIEINNGGGGGGGAKPPEVSRKESKMDGYSSRKIESILKRPNNN